MLFLDKGKLDSMKRFYIHEKAAYSLLAFQSEQRVDGFVIIPCQSKCNIDLKFSIGGDETITFTATHLAEIQEIFKNQGWGAKAPKRKPVLGNSVDNEVEQEQYELH